MLLLRGSAWSVQLHAQGSENSCSTDGNLVLAERDLKDIFIASTAELPGLIIAALVMDVFGRKWCASHLCTSAILTSLAWTVLRAYIACTLSL